MGLSISSIGVDSGLNWETNLNASLSIIDGHNHSAGNGVQITPAGFKINTSLAFNNYSAVGLQATVYNQQTSLSTIQAIYVGTDGNLYYNDGASNNIKITSGGTVNATSSGINSGSASASFSSGVLTVNSATNTPANISAGSLLIGQNVAGSNYVTLSPPSALSSGSYPLTLPAIPSAQSFMSIDTSGNMAGYCAVSGGITGGNIAPATITGANIASATITGGNIASATIAGANIASTTVARSNQVAVGQQISSSCGPFITISNTNVPVLNLNVTLTTSGRPVIVSIQPDPSGNVGLFIVSSLNSGTVTCETVISLLRGNTVIAVTGLEVVTTGMIFEGFPSSFVYIDPVGAGTYTYSIALKQVSGPCVAGIFYSVLTAYEL
jgi:hypothetical protein